MSIDHFLPNEMLRLFSKKLFSIAKTKEGRVINNDQSQYMPEYLVYATQGTSAGKRKQPKDIEKMKLDDNDR